MTQVRCVELSSVVTISSAFIANATAIFLTALAAISTISIAILAASLLPF